MGSRAEETHHLCMLRAHWTIRWRAGGYPGVLVHLPPPPHNGKRHTGVTVFQFAFHLPDTRTPNIYDIYYFVKDTESTDICWNPQFFWRRIALKLLIRKSFRHFIYCIYMYLLAHIMAPYSSNFITKKTFLGASRVFFSRYIAININSFWLPILLPPHSEITLLFVL